MGFYKNWPENALTPRNNRNLKVIYGEIIAGLMWFYQNRGYLSHLFIFIHSEGYDQIV